MQCNIRLMYAMIMVLNMIDILFNPIKLVCTIFKTNFYKFFFNLYAFIVINILIFALACDRVNFFPRVIFLVRQ